MFSWKNKESNHNGKIKMENEQIRLFLRYRLFQQGFVEHEMIIFTVIIAVLIFIGHSISRFLDLQGIYSLIPPAVLVGFLVSRVVWINITDHEDTDLHKAVNEDDFEKIKRLVDEGWNINEKGFMNNTPLHGAANEGKLEMARYLIDKSANLNAKDIHGNSPLHLAVWRNHPDVVQCLLDCGDQVDKKDEDGNTPLHHAAFGGHM